MEDVAKSRFLVVEDDPRIARSFVRVIGKKAIAESAASLAHARRAFSSGIYSGIVIDLRLPDGSGLELVEELRRAGASVPVLVVTGELDPGIANAAHSLGAECVFKPYVHENLTRFVERTLEAEADPAQRIDAALERLAQARGLSAREAEIARLVVAGVSREGLPGALGVSENTVKTLVKGLLAKCGEQRVESVARLVLEHTLAIACEPVAPVPRRARD